MWLGLLFWLIWPVALFWDEWPLLFHYPAEFARELILRAEVLIPIYGVMLANILFSAVICVLNSMSIRKFLGHKNEWKKTYLQPAIASAGMGLLAAGVYYGLFALTRRPFIALMIAVLLAVAAYLILYVVVTGTGEEEMRRFPMGGKVVKILRILKIYR